MPITDKIEAAKKIDELLKGVVAKGGFRLRYRITVNPKIAPEVAKFGAPEILVEFGGPDSSLMLERSAELLRSLEQISLKALRLESEEHEKISFDCMGFKAARTEELRLASSVAAEKVRKSGVPFEFQPMSARERRIVHLALKEEEGLRTESSGEGGRRFVVVYPKDYVVPRRAGMPAASPSPRRR